MRKFLTQFFSSNKKRQETLGVTPAIITTEHPPTKEPVGTVSEELRLKFVEVDEKRVGYEEALVGIAHAIGKLRLEQGDLWPAVYAELGLEDSDDITYSINKKTGVISKIVGPEE